MNTALFISPHDVVDVRSSRLGHKALFGKGVNFTTHFTKKVIVLPSNIELFRAGEKTVEMILHDAHLRDVAEIERFVIFVSGYGMRIVEPMIAAVPPEKIIWLVCKCSFDKVKDLIEGANRKSHIIRAWDCKGSDQMGGMVMDWLNSRPFGSTIGEKSRSLPPISSGMEPSRH